jgi:uncharacterized protein YbaR (Trm112 family)
VKIDRRLLDLLACPACKGALVPCPDREALCCERCRLRYPVREGIPVLLIDEAESLEPERP